MKTTPLFNNVELCFIQDALNCYWNNAVKNLNRKDLGDIERKSYEQEKNKAKELMDKIDNL